MADIFLASSTPAGLSFDANGAIVTSARVFVSTSAGDGKRATHTLCLALDAPHLAHRVTVQVTPASGRPVFRTLRPPFHLEDIGEEISVLRLHAFPDAAEEVRSAVEVHHLPFFQLTPLRVVIELTPASPGEPVAGQVVLRDPASSSRVSVGGTRVEEECARAMQRRWRRYQNSARRGLLLPRSEISRRAASAVIVQVARYPHTIYNAPLGSPSSPSVAHTNAQPPAHGLAASRPRPLWPKRARAASHRAARSRDRCVGYAPTAAL